MDFSKLLGLAQQKQLDKSDIKRYSTKVKAPKKVSVKEKKLSENVKLFMAKKDAELKARYENESLKRNCLLSKRRQDKKSTRTMKSMLSRTKSASKSVLPDSESNLQSTGSLGGRHQCDEDDYGYESSAARAFYEKLMVKYESIPKEEKVKDKRSGFSKSGSKALSTSSHLEGRDKGVKGSQDSSFKRNECNGESTERVKGMSKKEREKLAQKKRRLQLQQKAHLPLPSFQELIELAAQTKSSSSFQNLTKKSSSEAEFHRPMTNKMKEDFKRERLSQLRKAGKLPMTSKSSFETTTTTITEKKMNESSEVKEPKTFLSSSKKQVENSKKSPQDTFKETSKVQKRDINSVSSRAFPGERPLKSVSSSSYSYFPNKSVKRNRIESDSEEEEVDSEMDEFIDDSEANIDISAQIRSIFGYDRRRFANEEDFDDKSMVANYSTIMKEEVRSAKIGRLEDLEDMRKEEEEKRQKLLSKKPKGKIKK